MSVIDSIIAAESDGNPVARNPRSSAFGAGQFISGTWMDMLRRHRPDLLEGRSLSQALALRADPTLSREMAAKYTEENAGTLAQAGFEPTEGNLHLAYFAGPAGAKKALSADPNMPIAQVLGQAAVDANPHIANMTAGELVAWAARRAGSNAGASVNPTPGGTVQAVATGATQSGSPSMMQQEVQTLDFGDLPSARKKAMAEALMKGAMGRSGELRSRGGVLSALAQLYAGSHMAGQYEDQVNSRQKKMAQALMGAQGNDQLIRTLFASGDPDLVKAGVSSKIRTAEEATRRGLTPVPMFNQATGEMELGTVGGDGKWTKLGGADGYKAAPKASSRNVGNERITTDAYGNELRREKIDLSGAESEKQQGEAAGKARTMLPAVKTQVEQALSDIATLRSHPGLDTATGFTSLADPRNYIPGTDATDFNQLNAKARAESFMAAREGLKGAGQVTDFEGGKGEQAIANLATAQTKAQYLRELDTLERLMKASYEDLQRKASLDKVSVGGDRRPEPLGAPAESAAPEKPTKILRYNPATGNLE